MTEVVLGLLRRGDRYFLQRRALGNPVLPGLWEFPGGKVEAGESPLQALLRELSEEVGVGFQRAEALPVIEGPVSLHPFLVDSEDAPHTRLAWGWFRPAEMLRLPVPPANLVLIRSLGDWR